MAASRVLVIIAVVVGHGIAGRDLNGFLFVFCLRITTRVYFVKFVMWDLLTDRGNRFETSSVQPPGPRAAIFTGRHKLPRGRSEIRGQPLSPRLDPA